jgi:hypothetical protein
MLSSLNSPYRFCGPKQHPIQWVPMYFSGVQRSGHDIDHSQPAPMLKTGAGTFLLPLYVLIAWAGTFLSFVQYLDSVT